MTHLFLQAAELTKTGTDAAANVTAHTSKDPDTALLWFFTIVFGGALALLIYKLVWKPGEKPEVPSTESARITALESALAERKRTADADRMQDKLKFESDLAAISKTLGRLIETAEKIPTMMERSIWQTRELERHSEELRALQDQINKLYRENPRA